MSMDKRTKILKDATRAMVTQNLLDVATRVQDAKEQLKAEESKLPAALSAAKSAGISVAQLARITGMNPNTVLIRIRQAEAEAHGLR